MRRIPLLLALAGLAGCGLIKASDLPSKVTAIPIVSSQAGRYPALVKAGAPQLQVTLEKYKTSGNLRLSLATSDGVETWLSADGAEVMLKSGMIVATRGLVGDMMSSDVSASAALIHARRSGQAKRFQSYLGGEHDIILRAYICDIAPGASAPKALPGGTAVQMTETCHGETGDSFTDIYWVQPNGAIPLSLQYISAQGGRLALQRGAG